MQGLGLGVGVFTKLGLLKSSCWHFQRAKLFMFVHASLPEVLFSKGGNLCVDLRHSWNPDFTGTVL